LAIFVDSSTSPMISTQAAWLQKGINTCLVSFAFFAEIVDQVSREML